MKWHGKLTCMMLSWMAASSTYAAFDCDVQSLNDMDPREYTSSYMEQCAEAEAESKWKDLGLAAPSKSQELQSSDRERLLAVKAWQELSSWLAALQSGNANSAMDTVTLGFSIRAKLAAESIAMDVTKSTTSANALYRTNNWDRTGQVLPRPSSILPGNTVLDAIYNLPAAIGQDCQEPNGNKCKDSIRKSKPLMVYWTLAFKLGRLIGKESIAAIAQRIKEDDQDWQTYLYEGKPMLPLDIVLTDFIERKDYGSSPEYSNGRAAPPKRQWFWLHPSIGMEYVTSAADGQQLKPVLHLELVGVNWWRTSDRPFGNTPLLKYFSGVSLTASYADRAGVKDAGVGALFTFDNSMSVSISKYGSKPALSVSWSFLKADKSVDGSAESFKRKLIDSLPKEITAPK